LNILGIDFEEWYHPELVKPHIKNIKRNPSVINGIDKILDLLRKHETFATFFVVGELLEIQPDIFDKIIENDHEIGFHTMHHDRLDSSGLAGSRPEMETGPVAPGLTALPGCRWPWQRATG